MLIIFFFSFFLSVSQNTMYTQKNDKIVTNYSFKHTAVFKRHGFYFINIGWCSYGKQRKWMITHHTIYYYLFSILF